MSTILNQNVSHMRYGKGIIKEFDGTHIEVDFDGVVKTFVYPTAFEQFLKFDDESFQETIAKEISEAKAKEAEEKNKKLEEAITKIEAVKQYKSKTTKVNHTFDGVKLTHIKQGDSFDRIVDALNACLGRGYSGFQHAWLRLDDEYGIWFPKMAIVEGGSYVAQAEDSGWINTMDETGDYIFETNNNLNKLAEAEEDRTFKRLVFAKFEGRPYEFMGIYKRDDDKDSDTQGRHYVRIATETDLNWT